MAHTTSALQTKMTTEARNNDGVQWSAIEAAVELLYAGTSGLSTSIGVPGSDPSTVVAIQGSGSGTPVRTTPLGKDVDNAASTANPIQIGGVAKVGSSYAPGYTANDAATLAVDSVSGGLLCHTRTLTAANDAITSTPVVSAVAATVAYAASLVAKASAGRFFSLAGYNSKASAQFIQIHNAAALPAENAIPLAVITVPTLSNFSIDFGPLGIPCSTGIVVCNSSTGPTKTIGSADVWFTVSYV